MYESLLPPNITTYIIISHKIVTVARFAVKKYN